MSTTSTAATMPPRVLVRPVLGAGHYLSQTLAYLSQTPAYDVATLT